MTRRILVLGVAVAVAVCAAAVRGQPSPAQQAQVPALLDIVVRTPQGALSTEVRPEDFVFEGSSVSRPAVVVPPHEPWNIALMFDADAWQFTDWSRSLVEADPANFVSGDLLGRSLSAFARRMRANDRIAVAMFDDRREMLMNWFSPGSIGRQSLSSGVTELLRPPLGKDLYGAIEWISQRFGNAARRDVVLLTDGRDDRLGAGLIRNDMGKGVINPFFGLPDNSEAEEFEAVLDLVRATRLRFHVAIVNPRRRPMFHDLGDGAYVIPAAFPGDETGGYLAGVESRLYRLAQSSGGTVVFRGTDKEIAGMLERLPAVLGVGSTYRIERREGGALPRLQRGDLRVEPWTPMPLSEARP